MDKITTVVHCKKESYDTYIGRGSKWGNPYHIGEHGTREEVIRKYENYILGNTDLMNSLEELEGKVLGCWCLSTPINYIRKNKECHGEILLELLEKIK